MILLFAFLLSNIIQGNIAQSNPVFLTTAVTINSVNRVWDDISLIYPNQYHTPEQVIEELDLIASSAPEIVEMSILGQSVQGRLLLLTNF